MKPEVTEEATNLAHQHFAGNLVLAFVGGSRARGLARLHSDIDVFVMLENANRQEERAFAVALKKLHQRHHLSFDHCGEIFDRKTLATLLKFTEQLVEGLPSIQESACYRGNCLLSIFRKGDVVFNFFADPKICICDPFGSLPDLEIRARKYIKRWPVTRAQQNKRELSLPGKSKQARLAHLWRRRKNCDLKWTDTPVGIGLERWFGEDLRERMNKLGTKTFPGVAPRFDSQSCPIAGMRPEDSGGYATQCLACVP
jgi:predicted nucleotidyltransferase